jgi:hypothetical protein
MKNTLRILRLTTLLSLSLTSFSLPSAHAGKGSSGVGGGGGDVIILPDDRVILADFFIQETGEKITLPLPVVEELKRVRFIFEQYAAIGSFVDEDIFNPFVEYRIEDGISMPCKRVNLGPIPGKNELGGCSTGMTTYLDKNFLPRMTIRHFALIVVHERLRARFPNIDDIDLKEVTIGVDVALDLINDQLNDRFTAGPDPVIHEKLTNLRYRLYRLFKKTEINSYKQQVIHLNGGGILANGASVPASTVVSLSTVILKRASASAWRKSLDCRIGENSILHAVPYFDCNVMIVRNGGILKNLHFEAMEIKDLNSMDYSDLERYSPKIAIQEKGKLVNSTFKLPSTSHIPVITNYEFYTANNGPAKVWVARNAEIENSEIQYESLLALSENAKLSHSVILQNGNVTIGKNSSTTESKLQYFLGHENAKVSGIDFTNFKARFKNANVTSLLLYVGKNSTITGKIGEFRIGNIPFKVSKRVDLSKPEFFQGEEIKTSGISILPPPIGILEILPESKVEFPEESVCEKGDRLFLKGRLAIRSVDDLKAYCSKIN